LLCYFLMAVACYILGQKYLPVPYNILNGLAYLFYAVLLIEIAKMIFLPSPYLSAGFHIVLMLVFALSAFWRERKYWNTQAG
jgi:hypothetical protein